jgi:hypothetical protein
LLQRFRATTVIQQRFPRALRLALTVVGLLAFTFQSYVAQTHIHRVGQIVLASIATNDAEKTVLNKKDRLPANQEPSNCPICQELLHSGSFITPRAIAALPPALSISVVLVRLETTIAPAAVSHSWRGRAPPHA